MTGSGTLLAGVAEIDITPPIGTFLAGSLKPRQSTGIEDPLYVKAISLQSGEKNLVYVIFDLVALDRNCAEIGMKLTYEKTGIPPESIVWAASHTHTGPYTGGLFLDESLLDRKYLESIPEKMAQCIAMAEKNKKAVKFSRTRSFHYGLSHNRRILFKNGRVVNTWLLHNAPDDVQSIGSAGPIDPEIGIFCFDDLHGNPVAIIFHFTLHTNTNFGPKFSADYPGVVAARIRERFGPDVITLFMPGACGDINSTGLKHRQVGDALAEKIISAIETRKPASGPVFLDVKKNEITVPIRDFSKDQTDRIMTSGWDEESQKVFFKELEIMRKTGRKEDRTVLQAWCIGDTGFVSLPGELFVEWGLKIKKESSFPFTYPVELGGDYLGYLITQQAWKQIGYESLIARSARPTPTGVEKMVQKAIEMLCEIYKEKGEMKK
ncbi:MAG: hypothetical protein ACP5JO_01585 [Candidatus Ratteibacteria bacterium]